MPKNGKKEKTKKEKEGNIPVLPLSQFRLCETELGETTIRHKTKYEKTNIASGFQDGVGKKKKEKRRKRKKKGMLLQHGTHKVGKSFPSFFAQVPKLTSPHTVFWVS